jgi:hypothetical protein
MQTEHAKQAASLLILAPLMTLLNGCQTVPSSGCVPLIPYSPAFQRQAAKELPQAGRNVQQLVTDYGKTRDAIRAVCR